MRSSSLKIIRGNRNSKLFGWIIVFAWVVGCSEQRANRGYHAALQMEQAAEDAFLRGKEPEARQQYERIAELARRAGTLSKRKPVQEKAEELLARSQRHLDMYGDVEKAGQVALDCLRQHHGELSHYLDLSIIAKDIVPVQERRDVSVEDRLALHKLFGSFLTELLASGNPFEVATCKVVETEQEENRTLCHVTCEFAGVETTLSLSLSKGPGGRWMLRDFIIHGLGVSCMSAFRDSVIAMLEQVPLEELVEGDRDLMRRLEAIYHQLTDKGGDDLLYESCQGRDVEILVQTEILDEEGKTLREAKIGEIFFVVLEAMKEDDLLWLRVQLDSNADGAKTGWILKEFVKIVPLPDEEVWGLL